MEIQAEFGRHVIAPDGRLRRDELARIVFADAVARQKLEAILHPRIRERWLAQIESWRGENHPLAVVVIPLLFETRAEVMFRQNHLCRLFRRHPARTIAGARLDAGPNRQRLAAQWPVEQKIVHSDFVVWTDGALECTPSSSNRFWPGCNVGLRPPPFSPSPLHRMEGRGPGEVRLGAVGFEYFCHLGPKGA